MLTNESFQNPQPEPQPETQPEAAKQIAEDQKADDAVAAKVNYEQYVFAAEEALEEAKKANSDQAIIDEAEAQVKKAKDQQSKGTDSVNDRLHRPSNS